MISKVVVPKKGKGDLKIPEDFPYKLPNGIHWTREMYDSVIAYGIFILKHQVYCAYKIGAIQNSNGEKVDEYMFRSSSNFSIRILQHIMDEKFPMRLVEIENIYGKKITFDCQSAEFTTMLKFKALIEGKGNFSWKGTPTEYEKLKMKLMDDMGEGRMINVLGWQPEGFFAFNNCAVNSEIIDYDENGRFDYKGEAFYVPSANHIYKANPYKFVNQRKVLYIDTNLTFRKWSQQMVKVHRNHAILPICFGIACCFSDYIYKTLKFFPMMFLYGAASTGKGNLIRGIQSLFGEPQDTMTITGSANTDKAKIRVFAQFNNMVVFLDEYNNTLKQEGIEMLKGLWDRHGYTRGNIDSNFGTNTVPISSGVMMTGNDYPANNELITRLIVIEMMKDKFSPEEKKNFDELNTMIRMGYSNLLVEFVKHRKDFQLAFIKTFSSTKREMSELLDGIDLVERMVDNVAVLATVYKIFEKKLNFSFSMEDLKKEIRLVIEKQNTKRDTAGDVQKFWDCFIQAIRDSKIAFGVNFTLDGSNLIFYFRDIHNAYLQTHYLLYRTNGLHKSTLLDKLKKSNSFKEDLKSIRIGDRNSSAFCFDCKKIDQSFHQEILALCSVKSIQPETQQFSFSDSEHN